MRACVHYPIVSANFVRAGGLMFRKCPRTLDKPILLFGLELEDVALLSLIAGVGSLLCGPHVPGVMSMAGWVILMRFKRGKPSAYLLHCLYKHGFDVKGLIPPPSKVKKYGSYGGNTVTKF